MTYATAGGVTLEFGEADTELESQVLSFSADEDIIGHFGSSNSAGVVDLGFISKNAECVAEKVAEDAAAAEAAANAEGTDEDVEDNSAEGDGEGQDGAGEVNDTDQDSTFGSVKEVSFESKGETEDDGSDVVMWVVVIVIIAIVLAVIIIIVVHCCTKNKSTSITKVGDFGTEMKTGPATANNSSSIPQESEEADKASAKNKESDRQYFGNTEEV